LDVRGLAKIALLKVGARRSERALHVLNGLFDYVELGWWLHARGFGGGRRFPSCFEIPGAVAAELDGRAVLYLQFGGDDTTMATRWAAALPHPDTRLVVFAPPSAGDRWLPARGRGHAWEFQGSLGRDPREAARVDSRIEVLSGAPLPELIAEFDWRTGLPLVVVFDTDLYATTKVALDFVAGRLTDESFLFFDQLNHRADELRAFHEFLEESGRQLELFAANREHSCIAFRGVA
jgi:hypothetical protein